MFFRVLIISIICIAARTSSFAQDKNFLLKTINHTQGFTSVAPLETMQDSHGLVWIVAYDGLYTFDGYRATRKEVRNCDTCAASGDFIYGLKELPKGKYWMLTGKGIGSFEPLSGIFTMVKPIPNILWCNNISVANDSCLRIAGCSREPMLFNVYRQSLEDDRMQEPNDLENPEQLFKMIPKYPALNKKFGVSESHFFRWHMDVSGNIWCINGSRLFRLEPGNDHYTALGNDYPILSGANISSSRLDSKGILWLTIQGAGVVMIDTKESAFNALTAQTKQGRLVKDFVIGMYPYGADELAVYPQFSYIGPATILNTRDMKTYSLQGDKLVSRVLQQQFLPIIGNASNYVSIYQTLSAFEQSLIKDGSFFFGKNGKHYSIEAAGLTMIAWPSKQELLKGVAVISTKYLGDTLWLGTESHGLVAIDLNTSAVSTLQPTAAEGGGFDSWTVFGIVPDGREYLWLATSRGLWHFNKSTRAFTGYGTPDGLPNPYIYCITKDMRGNLWLGTGSGLSCFDPQEKTFRNFFPADGLVNIEYNRNSAYTARDGRVFMGGSHGVDCFYPDGVISDSLTAKPFFSAIYQHNLPISTQGEVKLNAAQNSLTFFLGVDEPFKADKYRFQWRLDGMGEDWADVGRSRILNLANLTANDYTLRVRMLDPSGSISIEEAIFTFSIAPYWFETLTFRIMAILLATGILSFFLAYRQRQKINRLKQENVIMRLKAAQAALLQQERERITADLHDDAGATLSSIYIYSDLANRMWEDKPTETRALLGKMAETSRDMMQKMNDIIWSLKPPDEEKNALHLRLANFSLDLFGNTDTQVHFDMDDHLDAQIEHAAARKNLLLIAREALNNVAKYSEAAHVWISLKKERDSAILSIRDDGKGFDATQIREGNGMGNMRRRAQHMGGKLVVTSKPGEGVLIHCVLPLPTISYT